MNASIDDTAFRQSSFTSFHQRLPGYNEVIDLLLKVHLSGRESQRGQIRAWISLERRSRGFHRTGVPELLRNSLAVIEPKSGFSVKSNCGCKRWRNVRTRCQ